MGVICSCLTSFPGFFQYHLPTLRSIVTFFSSSFKSLHLSRSRNRSSDPSNTSGSKVDKHKRLATKDIKVTLGSQVDGRGRFLHPSSVFAAEPQWLPLSEVSRHSSTPPDNATHREYYEEMTESQRLHALHLPSPQSDLALGGSYQIRSPTAADYGPHEQAPVPKVKPRGRKSSAWWKPSQKPSAQAAGHPNGTSSVRTGYWDIMSFFRTDDRSSHGPSKVHSESDESAV